MFLAGQLDAVSLVDPFLHQLERAGKGHAIFTSREIPGLIADVLVVRRDLETVCPGATQAVVDGYFQALAFWRSHDEEATSLMAKSCGLGPDEFRQVQQGLLMAGRTENEDAFGLNRAPGSLIGAIGAWEKILGESGESSQSGRLASFLDSRFVKAAAP
ncbi:MAG: ABC transporter substrate-binding protein [Candidatus Wallbacteria bacterium]|nr:ABC transporter substrate-binding protein [Candidatus Wallbacteria bacterium]